MLPSRTVRFSLVDDDTNSIVSDVVASLNLRLQEVLDDRAALAHECAATKQECAARVAAVERENVDLRIACQKAHHRIRVLNAELRLHKGAA